MLADRQVLEAVEALAVGDLHGGAANPRRARRFNGHAGEDAAGVVLTNPRETTGRGLGADGGGRKRRESSACNIARWMTS